MNFLLVHWLKSNSEGMTKMDRLSGYYTGHKLVITHLLATKKTMVAVNKDNHSHVLGFLTYDDTTSVPIIHYAYIKPEYRKAGLYNTLVARTIGEDWNNVVFTHLPQKWQKLYSKSHGYKYFPNSIFYSTLVSFTKETPTTADPTEGLGAARPRVEYRRRSR
jgi:predicted acetyltransferase